MTGTGLYALFSGLLLSSFCHLAHFQWLTQTFYSPILALTDGNLLSSANYHWLTQACSYWLIFSDWNRATYFYRLIFNMNDRQLLLAHLAHSQWPIQTFCCLIFSDWYRPTSVALFSVTDTNILPIPHFHWHIGLLFGSFSPTDTGLMLVARFHWLT